MRSRLLVVASEIEAKKAALISNMVRSKMHPTYISKVLLDIYESVGYPEIDTIITNLHRLVGGPHDGAFLGKPIH